MIEPGQIVWVVMREKPPPTAILARVGSVDFSEAGIMVETGLSRSKVSGAMEGAVVADKYVRRGNFDPLDIISLVGTLNRSCPFCINGRLIMRVDVGLAPWPLWPEWTGNGWTDDSNRDGPPMCKCVYAWITGTNSATIQVKVGANNTAVNYATGDDPPPPVPGFRTPSGRRPPLPSPEKLRSMRAEQRRQSRSLSTRPPNAR